MATYKQIEIHVRKNYKFTPKSCWIAHVKEISGLQPRISHRRYDPKIRKVPCPADKVKPIQDVLHHFGMIK